MALTILEVLATPSSTFDYCAGALGHDISDLMDYRFHEQEIICVGKESTSIRKKPMLKVTVGWEDLCVGYLFNRDFKCVEVCIYTEFERFVSQQVEFYNTEFEADGENKWRCQNQLIDPDSVFKIHSAPHEALGHVIVLSKFPINTI